MFDSLSGLVFEGWSKHGPPAPAAQSSVPAV